MTLIELMVGVFIALFLTAAAVAFTVHETRLMGVSRDTIEVSQTARATLDLLSEDLRKAGTGVGYNAVQCFNGLLTGQFNVNGIVFNPDNGNSAYNNPAVGSGHNLNQFSLDKDGSLRGTYPVTSHSVGSRFADGSYATIADLAPGTPNGQLCFSPNANFVANQYAVFISESALDARPVTINVAPNDSPCTYGQCAGGCRNFTWAPLFLTPVLESSPSAADAGYLGGEIAGGLKTVVWYPTQDANAATLNRVVFDQDCGDLTCGGPVADNIESFTVQAWQWNSFEAGNQGEFWRFAGQPVPCNYNRIRLDVEMVVRGRRPTQRVGSPVALRSSPNVCLPGGLGACPGVGDYVHREVYRTTIEIKNSGRMRLE